MLLAGAPANADTSMDTEPVVEPESCVSVARIRRTRIVDDSTILFYMNGGEIFVNHLPRRCPGLRINDAFGYETSLSVLCNVEVIHVLRNIGGDLVRGPTCGLGMFEPVTADQADALLAGPGAEPKPVVPEIEPGPEAESAPEPETKAAP
ncbi:MAG TPA: hypothetical protein ENK16_04595 [Chromatiales bacterium]|nr:hypothetical protein [Chromatiales bacterium]